MREKQEKESSTAIFREINVVLVEEGKKIYLQGHRGPQGYKEARNMRMEALEEGRNYRESLGSMEEPTEEERKEVEDRLRAYSKQCKKTRAEAAKERKEALVEELWQAWE
eukprot:1234214-Lingulodinium_polyedra.AAC.1